MDRGTQVSLDVNTTPAVIQQQERLLRRVTSMELQLRNQKQQQTFSQARHNNMIGLRPKSLSTDTFHRSKITFLSENANNAASSKHLSSSEASVSLPSISREHTPPPSTPYSSLATASPGMSYQQQQASSAFNGKRTPLSHAPSQVWSPPTITMTPGGDNNDHHQQSFCCQCFEPTSLQQRLRWSTSGAADGTSGKVNSTPEGLSWRRLHLSRAKLKATSTTSELLSGFAMVAMVELQINEPTNVPEWLFVVFAVCTTVLVSVHIFALMISTYILPNIDAISKLDVCHLVAESPHERMRGFIEIAWAFSTVLGLFLFLVEVGILCWVKFWDYSINAAIAATVVVIPVLVVFVLFAVHFYHSLVVFRCDTSLSDMQELEQIKRNLDEPMTTHLNNNKHQLV